MSFPEPTHQSADTVPLPIRQAPSAPPVPQAGPPTEPPVGPPPPPLRARAPKEPATTGRDILAALGVVVGMAALGLLYGTLWALLTPRVEMVHVEGGWTLTEENPEQYMAADGVFTLIGLGLGVAAGLVVWLQLKQRRGGWVLTGLVLGGIACQTVAWRFGRIGRESYLDTMDQAGIGWHLWRAPELLMVDFNPATAVQSLGDGGGLSGMFSHLSLGVLATTALAAAFVYTVAAGWSKYPGLRGTVEQAQPTDGI